MPAQTAHVDLGEATIHYRLRGENGPAIVFLHGAGGVVGNGEAPELLAESFRVFEPSLPGWDDSPADGTDSLQDQVEVVAEFIRHVVGAPTYVVAQSYGARVGAWLAVRHPDLVSKLVLSAPGTLVAKAPAAATAEPTPEAMERARRAMFGDADVTFTDDETALMGRNARYMVRFMEPERTPSREETLGRLAEIACPVLLLWAAGDAMIAPEDGPDTFKQHVKDLRVEIIPVDGHLLPVVAPDQYAAHVREFLA